MIGTLFSISYASVQAADWSQKKQRLTSLLRDDEFERRELAAFETDRHHNNGRYIGAFCDIFSEELQKFGFEMGFESLNIQSMWSVRYRPGDYHAVHNHRSTGYSGILYVDYDEAEHTPSIHVAAWNDPATDMTQMAAPPVREGTIVFVPSSVLHFTRPNDSDKLRQILAFDIDVK